MSKKSKLQETKTASILSNKRIEYFYGSIIILTVIAIGFFLIPGISGDKKINSPRLRQEIKLGEKIGQLETDVQKKREEIFVLMKKYGEETGETLPALKALGLSEKEKKMIKDKIRGAPDGVARSLLIDILDKSDDITEIKEKIKKFEDFLEDKPHKVSTESETHRKIALDFLMKEKGVAKEKALELVEQTALVEPLIPGFRVWNFYYNDEFITYVTQGDAENSPNEIMKRAKQRLSDRLEMAKSENESLTARISELESAQSKLLSKVLEMEKKINSLYFMVDLKHKLIEKKIIKRVGFLGLGTRRLKEISSEYFTKKIDLRKKKTIKISAKEFGLSEIKGVTLYPKFYEKGSDYELKVIGNKQEVLVTILAIEELKSERVIISLE